MLQTYYQKSTINVIQKIGALIAAEYFSVAQINNLQAKRFHNLLRHILKNSLFYQRYYKQHGINLENIDKIALKDLPPINKKIMMDNYDDFVCDPILKIGSLEKFLSNSKAVIDKYHNNYTVIHTSGSSGTIGLFVYGPNDWALVKAMTMARVVQFFPHCYRKSRFAFIGATDGHYAGVSLPSDAPPLLYGFLPLSINSPLESIVKKINAFQPDVLGGYSSGLHLLAQEQLKGNISLNPKRIISSADPLTPDRVETITKAFGRKPINFYAASESLCMAAQCERRENLHLFTDWHIFEAVDADLRPVAAGTPGNLLLTTLYNYTQPLIRYQMNDEIVMSEQPCGCGLPFPTIGTLAGRQEDFLWFDTPAGKPDFLHPIVLVEFFVSGLRKFQVIQTQKNELLMKVIIEGNRDVVLAAISQRMDEILRGKELAQSVKFNIEIVQDIPNDPHTGKFKLIISLTDR